MGAPLYTNEADPAGAPAQDARRAEHDEGAPTAPLPVEPLQDANNFRPAVSCCPADVAGHQRRRAPGLNLVISNVPGPNFRCTARGARLVANYPVSVITDGMGLNITAYHRGSMDFGLVADRDQMPTWGC